MNMFFVIIIVIIFYCFYVYIFKLGGSFIIIFWILIDIEDLFMFLGRKKEKYIYLFFSLVLC